jgi:hypothetical protein
MLSKGQVGLLRLKFFIAPQKLTNPQIFFKKRDSYKKHSQTWQKISTPKKKYPNQKTLPNKKNLFPPSKKTPPILKNFIPFQRRYKFILILHNLKQLNQLRDLLVPLTPDIPTHIQYPTDLLKPNPVTYQALNTLPNILSTPLSLPQQIGLDIAIVFPFVFF